VVNNDKAGSIITKKKNRKRSIKLQDRARKRSKNEPPNSAYYSDSELIFEIKIRSVNKDSEAVKAKIGTLKINSVNVVIEVLIH
jgi:hypothetical protein